MKNFKKLPIRKTETLGVFKTGIKRDGDTDSTTDTPSITSLSSTHMFNR